MQIIVKKDEFRELFSWYRREKKRLTMAENIKSLLHLGF